MSFFVWKLETICPCCIDTQPKLFGVSQCNNLRVVKHRAVHDRKTPVFIRENPKLFILTRISRDVDYDTAYTIMCLQKV